MVYIRSVFLHTEFSTRVLTGNRNHQEDDTQRVTLTRGFLQTKNDEKVIPGCHGPQHRIQPVEHPAVSGDQAAGILDRQRALDQAHERIPKECHRS